MSKATVTFQTRDQMETVADWLHNRLEEIKVSEYGEPLSCILIVDTESNTRAFNKGLSDTDALRLIDLARRLIKYDCRIEAE